MTTNKYIRYFNGYNLTSELIRFWSLGNLEAMDPEIPNLPLETNYRPYASHVSTDIIVASWTVAALPQQRQNRQIVDNTPAVDNPPPRSPHSLSFIPLLWQSEVRLQAQRKLPQETAIAADKPKAAPVNTIIASWFFTFAMPPRSPLAVLSSPPIPKPNLNSEIIARAWAPFAMPQTGRKQALSSPPIPRSTAISGIIVGAWAPFVLPHSAKKIAAFADAVIVDFAPGDSKHFQVNLVPTTWAVDYFDPRIRKSIAVFTPNIPPVVIPGTPAGGIRPYNEVATLGWGAIRAYPQVIFDLAYETPPRGVPEPEEMPAIAAVLASDDGKLQRYAEAAAAFDLALVRKYLEAMGIETDQ
jgi:hypothetical protein